MINYRPTSLSTVFPKQCTTPAYKQRTDRGTDGFRKGIPTEKAVVRPTDCVLKSINQKKCNYNIKIT